MSLPAFLRSVLPAACLALAACSHPKATVVEDPKVPSKPAAKRQTGDTPDPAASKPALGLREPDVVSELPDAAAAPANLPVPSPGTPSEAGTLIARPPR